MIPKIIHYCWLSGDTIPDNLQTCMDSWKKFLPDYEFKLWNLETFDINSVQWVKEAFEAKKYAFAADYIRLYAIYHYGGIYLDMDVEVLKTFNPLLHREYILGFETKRGIEAGVFGAPKHSYLMKICLDYYENRHFVDENGQIDKRPLPNIMFDVIKNDVDFENIFPNEYLTAKSYETGVINVTDNTYCIHHFAGSWLSPVEQKGLEYMKNLSLIPVLFRGHVARMWAMCDMYGFKTMVLEEWKWIQQKLRKLKII